MRKFDVWLNERDLVNLLSAPILENTRHIVLSNTEKDWLLFTLKVTNRIS